MATSARRIQKECKEVITAAELADLGISIDIVSEGSFNRINAEIRGPPDTPYEGGRFKLDVVFPPDYPFKPMIVIHLQDIHSGSSQTGIICLDILKERWLASLSLRVVLLSIQNLLACPEPRDPQDAVVAKQYMAEREIWNKTARFWTQQFAAGPGAKSEEMQGLVKAVMREIGSEVEAVSLLSCNGWDANRAIAYSRSI